MTNKTNQSITLALMALFAVSVTAGCDTFWKHGKGDLLTGAAQSLGNGEAQTFIQLNGDDEPAAFGVTISEAALTGLPAHGDHMSPSNSLVLDYPEAAGFPFEHLFLNWNPMGHEPPGIYDLPHFDFHFYTIPSAQREAISPADPEFGTKGTKFPATEYIPQGYVAPPGTVAVPMMGAHFVDPTSPELNGKTFTSTLLAGSYDGHLIFSEPMITKAFIESVKTMPGKRITFNAPLAQSYEKPGFYPTKYSISYDTGRKQYVIAMEGLVRR